MFRLTPALVAIALIGFGSPAVGESSAVGEGLRLAQKNGLGWPDGVAKPQRDCSCRPPGGGKAPVGAEICVRRDGAMVTLRCEMALNNTIWRKVRTGCDPVS